MTTTYRQPYEPRELPDARELVRLAETAETFKVRRRQGLTALNYAYVTGEADQFRWPFSEFRGLIIDERANKILARPFQKFWHAGEKQSEGTNWAEPHVVLPKLDGSLVYPARDRWVTKGGVTDTSLRAEKLVASIGEPLRHLIEALGTDPADDAPCTPLWEYIGPDNQMVLEYPRNQLVLLAVRRISDGRYWRSDDVRRVFNAVMNAWNGDGRLDIAKRIAGVADTAADTPAAYAKALIDHVGAWPGDEEGVVVAFEESGHRLKIKSREYVALHRARDDYSVESRVLRCWADGNTDKLLAQLAPDRADRLRKYYRAVERGIHATGTVIGRETAEVWAGADGVRKPAAIRWTALTEDRKRLRPLGFVAFDALSRNEDGAEAVEREIRRMIALFCSRQTSIDTKIRPLWGGEAPVWRPIDGSHRDADE